MLRVNHLGGWASSAEAYSLTNKGTQTAANTNSPSFTFTDTKPSSTRKFVAILTAHDGGVSDSTFSVGSVTIGGVSATISVQGKDNSSGRSCAVCIAVAAVPSGTDATVAASLSGFGGTMDEWSCGLLRVPGISTTALATASGTTTVTINPTAAAKFVALSGARNFGDLTGDTWDSGNGSRTTMLADTFEIIGYSEAPGAGSTGYSTSGPDDPDVSVAAAFGL